MTNSEITERLAVISDICDTIVRANTNNIFDQSTARNHLEDCMKEINSLLASSKLNS